jgi:hypothetical protein
MLLDPDEVSAGHVAGGFGVYFVGVAVFWPSSGKTLPGQVSDVARRGRGGRLSRTVGLASSTYRPNCCDQGI